MWIIINISFAICAPYVLKEFDNALDNQDDRYIRMIKIPFNEGSGSFAGQRRRFIEFYRFSGSKLISLRLSDKRHIINGKRGCFHGPFT